MNWRIYVRGKAKKQLKRLPKDFIQAIEKAIDEMSINPYSGDVNKMSGEENVWRRRVGNYRIKFEIYEAERLIYVFEIQRRTSNTY